MDESATGTGTAECAMVFATAGRKISHQSVLLHGYD